MLFTSGSFFVLVAVTLVAFYLPPLRRWQTHLLILASLVFYSLNPPSRSAAGHTQTKQIYFVALLLVSIAINASTSHAAFFAKDIRHARFWTLVGVTANLSILAFFKYS